MATARAKALQSVPLFAGLNANERELLASNLDEISFPAGKTLIDAATEGLRNRVLRGR